MVDFGSGQGLSDFETGKIACYFEDFKRAKTPPRVERCRLWTDNSLRVRYKMKQIKTSSKWVILKKNFILFKTDEPVLNAASI